MSIEQKWAKVSKLMNSSLSDKKFTSWQRFETGIPGHFWRSGNFLDIADLSTRLELATRDLGAGTYTRNWSTGIVNSRMAFFSFNSTLFLSLQIVLWNSRWFFCRPCAIRWASNFKSESGGIYLHPELHLLSDSWVSTRGRRLARACERFSGFCTGFGWLGDLVFSLILCLQDKTSFNST